MTPIHERVAMVEASHMTPGYVTLDGEDAVVCGHRNTYAKVARVGASYKSIQCSWECVRRVIDTRNGAFKS